MGEIVSGLRTVAYDSITVTDSATRLTLSNVRGTTNQPSSEKVIITGEGAQFRWRADGTDPTSSEGHLANQGVVLTFENRDRIEKFRAIRTGSTNATLKVDYLAL